MGTCLTKKASHNAKGGGIQKEYVKYFDVALELLFQFYKLQDVEEFSKNNTQTTVTISGNSGKLDLSKIQKKTKYKIQARIYYGLFYCIKISGNFKSMHNYF